MQTATPRPVGARTGFTLIELMVVISIISLLSSVVLSSLNYARQKGAQAAFIEEMFQYRNARALYKSTYGYFPGQNSMGWVCLGANTECGSTANITLPNASFNALLTPYINPVVLDPNPVYFGGYNFTGVMYDCSIEVAGKCTQAVIVWKMPGLVTCPIGALTSHLENTSCALFWDVDQL